MTSRGANRLNPDNLSKGPATLRGLVAVVAVVPIVKRRIRATPVNPRVSLTFGKMLAASARGRARLLAHVDRLLASRSWATTAELANAMFEWSEAFCNPRRRHSALGYGPPIDYETLHPAAPTAA